MEPRTRLALDSLTVAVELDAAANAIERGESVVLSPDVAECLIDTIRSGQAAAVKDALERVRARVKGLPDATMGISVTNWAAPREPAQLPGFVNRAAVLAAIDDEDR